MNLYVAGWGLTEQEEAAAVSCLQEIARDYPVLDAGTVWRTPSGARAFAACVQSNATAKGPRQYIHQQRNEIVLFDGCMVDVDEHLGAMRADKLAANWQSLPMRLEGSFSILRIRPQIPEMELLTDSLGLAQVFHALAAGKLMISNSVRILTRICQDSALDPLGVSMALSLDWASGDRTLNRAVQIVPGGAHWHWTTGADANPIRLQRNFQADLFKSRKEKISCLEANKLSDRMIAMLRAFGDGYKLQCPLTGGRDSRLLLSLLLRGKISAEYYTEATTGEKDIKTAAAIADRFHLPHRIHRPSISSDQWDALAAKLVRQNDGLVSLWQLADVIPEAREQREMPIRLLGIGGEIARRFYCDPKVLLLKSNDFAGATRWLERQTLHCYNGIVMEPAMLLARQFLREWVLERADTGYSVAELPDLFYAFERVRRWAGGNSRKIQESHDLFAPLCTRPFIETALQLPVWSRFSEPIHYQLIRLIPELHRIPFGGDSWLTQAPGLALPHLIVRKKVLYPLARRSSHPIQIETETSFDIRKVVEREILKLRSFCMDRAGSPLWELVDRRRFEQVTDPDTGSGNRAPYVGILCQIATLFYYEALQD